MTTPSNGLGVPGPEYNPAGAGLPSAADIAALAAVYFPEFAAPAAGTEAPQAADSLRILNEGFDAGAVLGVSAADSAAAAYAPKVLPKNNPFPEVCRSAQCARTAGILPPASQEPGKSIYVGPRELSEIRKDFPILSEKINGRDLVWLDNAATTQKPRQVLDRLNYFYEHENSNVHRGAHELAARSTDAYEEAREKVARFIGASSKDTVVFVRGATEGINLAAQAYVKQLLGPGDEIILTMLEHHANIVPWQIIAQETGAVIRVAPIDRTGQIILSEYSRLFNRRTRFVAAAQVSNALGTIAPVEELIRVAHAQGVRVLIDGAQSVPHIPVDVTALDADFFVLSGHKIFAPTGIGVLYGKAEVLEAARPYQGGGNMIADVTFERTLYQAPPDKFEAGTGNIAGAVGLGAALDYVGALGMANIGAYEHELVRYGTAELAKVPGLRLIGAAPHKAGVLSFVLEGYGNEAV
ncbi:MAG: cysteine desulfurase, partial [Treponema sp.]|nr:cysteine desulfurase [Treponema sp.]